MGVVPPEPGFTAGLAELCRRHGALLVSDEVMTGFRVSPAGWFGLEGVRPDLMTFGKVMGGGLPAAAFGGRADVMGRLAPGRTRLPGGHAVGEPRRDGRRAWRRCGTPTTRSTPASTSPLPSSGRWRPTPCRRPAWPTASSTPAACSRSSSATRLGRGRASRLRRRTAPGPVTGSPRSSTRCSTGASTCRPSAFESWFLSAAHDDDALSRVADALPAAAHAAAEARPERGSAMSDTTTVHVLRHGEVHNPRGVLYGRLPDYHLSDLGPGDGGRASPSTSPVPTSCTSCPRRWSGRRETAAPARASSVCRWPSTSG